MSEYRINKTLNTPEIVFDPSQGLLSIEGRSIPENPNDFYTPLFKWMESYFDAPKEKTKINIKLEYINSGSSKFLLQFLRYIKQKFDEGNECVVNWYYEEDDEAVQELGEHYRSSVKIPFNMIDYID